MHGMFFNTFSYGPFTRYADDPSKRKRHSAESRKVDRKPDVQSESRQPFMRMQWPRTRSVWHTLSLCGSITWALLVPVQLGCTHGMWIDTLWPSPISWASVLTPLGVVLGCVSAGYWYRLDDTKD